MAKSADEVAADLTASKPARGLDAEPFSSHAVFDNPSFGRALRYTFGDKRIGRAVFVNALFLVVALGAVQELWSRGTVGFISEKLPFGRAAFLSIAIVETLMVSILGPISFMHLFNAERREDCFDQVVATGCSPLRILLGRYAAMIAFVSVVALSALPFFVFASSVLRGASFGDVATFYVVLEVYAASLGAMVLATTVAIEDAAFPPVVAFVATLSAIVPAFARFTPPALSAWSPVRHLTVQLADVPRSLGLGEFTEPVLYGISFPTAPFSCALYIGILLISLAYVCVGPDLELAEGLDSFASVTLTRGGEASRGRRGLAATLLRAVQLRFFYENTGARLRGLGPALRLGATIALYGVGHFLMLGMVWPKVPPKSWLDIENRTFAPYLAFTVVTLGLMALASAGSRAAVLARVPVISIGKLRIGRFPAQFVLVGSAILLPLVFFAIGVKRCGLPLEGEDANRALGLYGIVALYAVFMFALALVWAMVTTNPYSAMGSTLMVLTVANLLPLGWVPLFVSNVVTEDSARVLDVSPIFAAWSLYAPSDDVPISTVRDEQTVQYYHHPGWKPYVYIHAPLAVALLLAGLALERRDAKKRRFLGALGIAGAFALVLSPDTARAQETPAARPGPIRVELTAGLGGKVPIEGFTPLVATLENASDRDQTIVVTIKEPQTGAVLAKLPPILVPRDAKPRVQGLGAADAIHDAGSLLVEAATEDGTILATAKAKVDALPRGEQMFVVLDRRGSLPFALQGSLRSSTDPTPRRAPHQRKNQPEALNWTPSYIARAEDLPQSELGWSGVGAVLVADIELDRMGTFAARALAGWVARGGDLIVAVGERATVLKRSELGHALEDALDGLPDAPPRRQVSIANLVADPSATPELASAVALLAPTPRDVVTAQGAEGEPLALRRRCGLGLVQVLAYDPWQPPLAHQDSTARLVEQTLARTGEAPPLETLTQELSQLRVQPAKIGPAFAALLLYALIIGTGIYFALKPKRRGVLAWILIPAGSLIAAAITPLYKVVLQRTESAIVTGSVIAAASGDSWELETSDSILFSGGLEDHDLAVRGDDVTAFTLVPRGFRSQMPRPGEPLGQTGAGRVADDQHGGLAFGLKVPLWGSRHIFADRVTRRAPRITGRLSLRAKGTFIELENLGREALEDPVVVYDEFRAQPQPVEHDFGAALAAGAKVASLVTQGNLKAAATAPHSRDVSELLERRIVEGPARNAVLASGARAAILVARLPERPQVVEARTNVRVRASGGVLVVRLPFAFEERVPFGLSTVTREDRETAAVGTATSTWIAETRIQLPPGSGTGKPPSRLRLEVSASGRPQDLRLALKDARTGAWVPLAGELDLAKLPADAEGNVSSGIVVRLPDPERFLDANGNLNARQELEGTSSTAKREGLIADLDVSVDWAPKENR